MEEFLKKTLEEKELVEHLGRVGIKGYFINETKKGLHYRFLDMVGRGHEFDNLSTNGRKKLRID